jgi:hypothetical protein
MLEQRDHREKDRPLGPIAADVNDGTIAGLERVQAAK